MATIAQRLAWAVQHHQAGRLGEAENLYRGILQEAPHEPHALHLLGLVAHQAGRLQEAIDLIRQALAAHGPEAHFHNNLAAVYLASGRPVEAETHCREALRLKPDLPDAHHNLGVALRGQGKLEEAESEFRHAIRLNPRLVDARCNLGAVLHQQRKLPEALAQLQETVRLAPGHAQAQNDLGGVLLACGQPEQAVRHLHEAIRLKPDFANAYSNLGLALEDLNQFDEAIECFREALRINPNYATAHNNLGSALEFQGRMDEALAEFQEALRLEPNNAMVIHNLSRLAAAGRYRFSDEQIREMKELAEGQNLPLDHLCRLHFALARLLDKAGADDEAFAHCRRANDLRKQLCHRCGVAFDPAAHHQLVDRLIATFTPEYFQRVASFGLDSESLPGKPLAPASGERGGEGAAFPAGEPLAPASGERGWGEGAELPIFVVGMPRSGTTLAEQILASHPQVHGAGELEDMDRLSNTLPQRLGGAESYPGCMARLDAATARALAESHVQKLRQLGGAAARVVDKMPFNFFHLGLIATLFPRACIIHCRRHPVDTCLSCYFLNFAARHPFALDLGHLGQYYGEYERLMAHWAKVLPLAIFELRYEELTADQEFTSRRLLAFCGLAWDERCLRFHETQRVVRTPSTVDVRQPIHRRSLGRWKRYQAHLQPLLEALRQSPAAQPQWEQ